jgi:hypothetical protein
MTTATLEAVAAALFEVSGVGECELRLRVGPFTRPIAE